MRHISCPPLIKKDGIDLSLCPDFCPVVYHRTLPVPAYTLFLMYSHPHFLHVNRAVIFDMPIVYATFDVDGHDMSRVGCTPPPRPWVVSSLYPERFTVTNCYFKSSAAIETWKMLNTGLGIWPLDQRVAVTRHKMIIMYNDYGDGSNDNFTRKTSICVILWRELSL